MKICNIANQGRMIYLFSRDEKGNQIIRKENSFYPHFFECDSNGIYKGYDGVPLRKVVVDHPNEVSKTRSDKSYSSDIKYVNNFLIQKVDKIEICPIKFIFVDIEVLCTDFPHPEEAKFPVSCITSYDSFTKEYNTWYLGEYSNEKTLLDDFVEYLKDVKPDLFLSWNVSFDYTYLHNRIKNFAKRISPINSVRMGTGKDIFYPNGISIVDYSGNKINPGMFSKVFMREASYALDYIGEVHLGKGKTYKDVDFSELNEEIKLRNQDDVRMMVELEEKYQIIPYYDELRRICKVKWEDLPFNSRLIEALLLEEAKIKNVILPNKKDSEEKVKFKGATRKSVATGLRFGVGMADLTSCYPQMIKSFCLDTQNVAKKGVDVNGTKFKQNSDALLPSIVSKVLAIKDNLKKELKTNPDIKYKYSAIKTVTNSIYGTSGSKFFRLYDVKVAESTTYLVRDLLMYVKRRIEDDGHVVEYYDTDGIYYNTKDNLTPQLNQYIQDWAKLYGKESIDLKFEYEGYFDKVLFMSACHYYGYIHGKEKPEIKGVEVKRVSSSKYESYFQRELIEKILNGENEEGIVEWISIEKERIKTLPYQEVSFPCKITGKKYESTPIFVRAYNYRRLIDKDFKVNEGELFYYTFIEKIGQGEDVIGFKRNGTLPKDIKIDWNGVIRRNITMKADTIFEIMKWDLKLLSGAKTLF